MASNFSRKTSRNIGTSATTVGSYTVGSGKATTIIGLSLSNVSINNVTISVTHFDGTNTTYLVKNAPIPVGGSLVIVGGDQKVVLLPNDYIQVVSSSASSVDAYMSILEVDQ